MLELENKFHPSEIGRYSTTARVANINMGGAAMNSSPGSRPILTAFDWITYDRLAGFIMTLLWLAKRGKNFEIGPFLGISFKKANNLFDINVN